ncbi:MAG: non-hydrolyzing UDP-N-acetylglucosamine 2-epimerase [Alphaproteobacteria bacterium]
MNRVLVIFGTRPEAVKMAPLIRALNQHASFESLVCVTAQHREMLDPILDLFAIRPDTDLDLMQPGQDLAALSARILEHLAPVLHRFKPDAVLVQGDTTTTFCAALAAFYQDIPVGHVEAGLRTGDIHAPFPEEMNRLLTTRLAAWHFAPTAYNRDTLLAEAVDPNTVFITGNPVIDALLWVRERIESGQYNAETGEQLGRFADRPFILVTSHRRETFGAGIMSICLALKRIADRHPELDLVYPVHLNPNVQEQVRRMLGDIENVKLIDPLGYEAFVALMSRARFILADSGGVQEEAPSLGRPVLVMRDKTERVEALEGGVRLVGTDPERIVATSERLLTDPDYYRRMAEAHNPYGDGAAARRIVDILAKQMGEQ